MELVSCNSFVVLPPLTGNGSVIFGKNSDRPEGEVQELIYEPPNCTTEKTLKCTFIEIDQVEMTYGVILSKPAWMWGCEMGANDQGVVIGNQPVLTRLKCSASKKALLGTDLARLALERSKTAEEAVDVITNLLAQYGQGGSYSDTLSDFSYHNSFLIADATEAWVLETADVHWVAEKVTTGCRNISSCLSIESNFDKQSRDVIIFAKRHGLWNGEGNFSFSAAYSEIGTGITKKYQKGVDLLQRYTHINGFCVNDMFSILRNSEISCGPEDCFPTAASQVSSLSSKKPSCHWFTATPNPILSVFKPFVFTPNVRISHHTTSPVPESSRRHSLYRLHAIASKSAETKVISLLQEMEQNCLEEVEKFLEDFEEGQPLTEVDELMKDVVETEIKFYK
ncbi:UNVERIFIED_CONTAM: hypothetical protein PYX00_004541 [Menopon gallinae]|uniref:Secernin-3 n=1 Tax=Menopon gallinae TaxID=328185 RepID=A0AAW2I466_9NEOP